MSELPLPSYKELLEMLATPEPVSPLPSIEELRDVPTPPTRDLYAFLGISAPIRMRRSEERLPEAGTFGILTRSDRSLPTTSGGAKGHTYSVIFVCEYCGTTKTPEKRRGPNGSRTLCNKCGLRWAREERMREQGLVLAIQKINQHWYPPPNTKPEFINRRRRR